MKCLAEKIGRVLNVRWYGARNIFYNAINKVWQILSCLYLKQLVGQDGPSDEFLALGRIGQEPD